MAVREMTYSHEDLVKMLLEHEGITEGMWQLTVRFRWAAGSLPHPEDPKRVMPAGLAFIQEIGITRSEVPLPGITVDASTGKPYDGPMPALDQVTRRATTKRNTGR